MSDRPQGKDGGGLHAENDFVIVSVLGRNAAPERGKDLVAGAALSNDLQSHLSMQFRKL